MGYRFIFLYLTPIDFLHDFSNYFYQFIQKEIRTRLENNYPIISDKLAQIFIICLLWDLLGLLPYTFISTRLLGATIFFAFPYFFSRVIILNRLDIKLRVIRVVYPGFGLVGTFAFLLIEVIRGAVRPFALYLRLLVNIVAGHLIDRIIIKLGPLFFSIHFYPRIFLGVSFLIYFFLIILEGSFSLGKRYFEILANILILIGLVERFFLDCDCVTNIYHFVAGRGDYISKWFVFLNFFT